MEFVCNFKETERREFVIRESPSYHRTRPLAYQPLTQLLNWVEANHDAVRAARLHFDSVNG
ncbi:hypothetical protein GFL51_00900 [Rhizobium leguminosarum bv. viciae]|nr:hypothetical protein [Rhizobium leguminosarum bv. viciae]